MRGAITRVICFSPSRTANASLHLGWHVIEKRFKLRRPKPLRLRSLVAVVKLDAFADQHLHGVAVVRRVVPLELEADRAVTAEDWQTAVFEPCAIPDARSTCG